MNPRVVYLYHVTVRSMALLFTLWGSITGEAVAAVVAALVQLQRSQSLPLSAALRTVYKHADSP